MKRIYAIVLRQFFLIRKNPTRFIPLFLWSALDIVLWGFITLYLGSIAQGHPFIPVLLGAVLLWDFLVRVMQGVTTAFFEDVWSRNFLNLFASPITVPEYLIGLVITSILTSIVGLVVMLLLAVWVFSLSLFTYGILFVPFIFILFVFGIALGIFGIGIVLRLGPAAEWFIWPIPAVLAPFASVFYPLATLPSWMQGISLLLPPTYVFEGMRAIVQGDAFASGTLAIGAVLALVYLLLASGFFVRVYRRAIRTGLISRYSAESIS